MFEEALARMASFNSPRFRLYIEGKAAYEAVLREIATPFHQLTCEHYRRAAADQRLHHAERCYREAIELCRSENALPDIAGALGQLGMLLHLTGRLAEAEECLMQGSTVLQELPRPDKIRSAALSSCRYHLGLLKLKAGDLRQARRHLQAALTIDEEIGDFAGIAVERELLSRLPNRDAGEDPQDEEEPASASQPALPVSGPSGTAATPALNSRTPPRAPDPNDEDEVELTGPFSNPTNDVLWILAFSKPVVKDMQALVAAACPAGRRLTIQAADAEMGIPNAPEVPPGAQLCGALFVLDPNALRSGDFRGWLTWCIQRVRSVDDFRVFVLLRGFSEDIFELAHRDPLVDELINTIHLERPDESRPPEEILKRDLRRYLLTLELIRDRARWRRFQRGGKRVLGGLCHAVLFIVILGWLALSAAALLSGKSSIVHRVAIGIDKEWIGVFGGLPVFWANTLVLTLLFHGPWRSNRMLQNSPAVGRWLIAALVVLQSCIWLPYEIHSSYWSISAGVVLGLLLEAGRRARYSVARGNLLKQAYEWARRDWFNHPWLAPPRLDILRWPLFSATRKVFISYSRSSRWGEQCASQLHHMIEDAGGKSFLDQRSLPPGSSWQRDLDQRITDSVVFVSLCDARSIHKDPSGGRGCWIAAETIMALELRRTQASPDFILLTEPSLASQDAERGMQVFRRLLTVCPATYGGRRVIVRGTTTLTNLAVGLTPAHYQALSVFPEGFRLLVSGVLFPLIALSTILPMFGIPALFVGIGAQFGKIELAGWFGHSFSWWLCPAIAYALGATLRLAIGARFEGFGGMKGRSVYSTNKISIIGYGLLLSKALQQPTPLVIAWTVASFWLAWLIAVIFLRGLPEPKSN